MIRAAAPADMAAVAAIYRPEVIGGTATFETEPPDAGEMARRFRTLDEAGLPALVAEDADGIAGYAYAAPFRERAAFRYTLENSIYVRDGARGRGVGTTLLDALLRDAAARGFRQMIAVIGDAGNAASVALHARAGFSRVGALAAVGWKFERWLDVVLMQRALTPPP